MEEKRLKINNLLDVFMEAEDNRAMGTLSGMEEKHQQFMGKYLVGKKDVERLQNQINIDGAPNISEKLKSMNLTPAEMLIFNSSLKNLMEGIIVDMISKGVIVLEIKDSSYDTHTSELTLTCMAANPMPSVKRIDIKRRKGD